MIERAVKFHRRDPDSGRTDFEWRGSMTMLLSSLALHVSDADILRQQAWPRTPAQLSNRIKRLEGSLAEVGVHISLDRSGDGRDARTYRITSEVQHPPEANVVPLEEISRRVNEVRAQIAPGNRAHPPKTKPAPERKAPRRRDAAESAGKGFGS